MVVEADSRILIRGAEAWHGIIIKDVFMTEDVVFKAGNRFQRLPFLCIGFIELIPKKKQ